MSGESVPEGRLTEAELSTLPRLRIVGAHFSWESGYLVTEWFSRLSPISTWVKWEWWALS